MATVRVLIVDDNSSTLKATCRLLSLQMEYEVLSASGPRRALEIVRSESQVDLVVSDVTMPEMSGPELLCNVARISPATAGILMSGDADVKERVDLPLGVPLLQKPFSASELFCTIKKVLARV
jgi:DNA-binding NtrC family response regulator